MMPGTHIGSPAIGWLASVSSWMNPRRVRAQLIILAVCLWGVCIVDLATPGSFDRVGNIKFQDALTSGWRPSMDLRSASSFFP
jgi:hypothetical protein